MGWIRNFASMIKVKSIMVCNFVMTLCCEFYFNLHNAHLHKLLTNILVLETQTAINTTIKKRTTMINNDNQSEITEWTQHIRN